LPSPSLGTSPTVEQLARAFDDLQRNLTRWTDALPFGGFGFSARRTNNGAAIANTATGILKFNQVDDDMEGWWNGGDQDRFYCPPGGSGWYLTQLTEYLAAPKTDWYMGVRRIDTAGTVYPEWQVHGVADDRLLGTGLVRLEDGEGIEGYIVNFTGGSITPNYVARDTTTTPWLPHFRILRICLL
jgi:hypothetical protein